MQIYYARTRLPKSIFLAGPTPRDADTKSWRPAALEELNAQGFDGSVFVPEDSSGSAKFEYDDQVQWEWEGLSTSTVALFWVPRELKSMPAMVTNVEFGLLISSGKVVFGTPPEAQKMGYLKALAKRYHVEIHSSLEDTVRAAIKQTETPYE